MTPHQWDSFKSNGGYLLFSTLEQTSAILTLASCCNAITGALALVKRLLSSKHYQHSEHAHTAASWAALTQLSKEVFIGKFTGFLISNCTLHASVAGNFQSLNTPWIEARIKGCVSKITFLNSAPCMTGLCLKSCSSNLGVKLLLHSQVDADRSHNTEKTIVFCIFQSWAKRALQPCTQS